jgi:glucose/arabinose dehydrogenase
VGIEGVDEIYAYGFRNPYRFSFDKLSGILIVADVGQGFVEEINIVRKGHNYGWNIKEGDFLFDPEDSDVGLPFEDTSLIDPVAQYDHDDGLSVIGGYMYYGAQVPELRGLYVFGDFSRGFTEPDGRLLVADLLTGHIEELLIGKDSHNLNLYVKGIAQDHDGEIYVLASSALGPYGNTGVVLKVVGLPPN